MDEWAVAESTLRALAAPRRAIPILVVCVPLIYLQWRLSADARAAPLGVCMCLSFVLLAPLAWRVLVPDNIEGLRAMVRVLLYGACGIVWIAFMGRIVPAMLGMASTLLTLRSSLIVCCTLFLAGGWGLGRDIDLEAKLLRERARVELLAREAEHAQLVALRSHLDPHFLFNTLNAIAEWCRQDGEVAERAILRLSQLLRSILTAVKSPAWSLRGELDLVRDLFELHLLRDPELFTLAWEVPSPVPDIAVPPMLLLPIAENAVKHGPAAGYRGAIRVVVRAMDRAVRIAIDNPGRYAGPRAGSEGLPTVARRLELSYSGSATMQIVDDGDRTRIELVLPREGPKRGALV